MVAEVKEMPNRFVEDAKDLLLHAAEQGYVSVHVIGETPDGMVHIKASCNKSVPEKIAALEIAKLQLYERWE